MKILRITLNNIASLAGTHTVDFTRDPLRSAGLFSISGPTGAGKSSLLDALCLALYDSTPRLQQVGRLAELAQGEKQNDPRMLLRRGAGEGFAEVAFVGVDGQSWTSRWSVRRSHKKTDGALQHVEMVLYRGHITSGGDGPVAEGGKKTAVLSAISEKIGLSFEQFTRAVLLAQNDFATFLKADDRERAEILQALTGTEHFEAISKAVYARAVGEKQAIESLESRLQGNAPLSAEVRSEADVAAIRAAEQVSHLELRLKDLESHAAWFPQHAKITDEQAKAQDAWRLALENRDGASPRRTELSLTETVSRDGRPLHSAERQAFDDVEKTSQACALVIATQKALATIQAESETNREAAEAALAVVAREQSNSRPFLNQARELDAKLEPLHVQFERSVNAVEVARSALLAASTKLQATTLQRTTWLKEHDSLLREREQLALYVPFVADAARWLDRIDGAISARAIAAEARDAWHSLSGQLQQAADGRCRTQQSQPELQSACDAATKALQEAIAAETEFDSEQLAVDRAQFDIAQRVLTRLGIQLQQLQSHRERAELVNGELDRLVAEQAAETASLQELRDVELSGADHAFQAARSQLELIQAAVDDHAKRLRTTLQEGRECPVCGSVNHPYSEHEPDADATAVQAAKKSVRDFEKRRDEIQNQAARLSAAIQSRSGLISAGQTEHQTTQQHIRQFCFDANDHPEVAAMLALPQENRLAAAEQRAVRINEELNAVAEQERARRTAAKQTDKCRQAMEQLRDRLQQLKQQLVDLDRQYDIACQKTLHAAGSLEAAEKRRNECMNLLSDLWAGLPSAGSEFDADSARFRESFENATNECCRLEIRLVKLTSKIQEANAAIEPLKESQTTAQGALNQCELELQSVMNDRDQYLQQRSLLFEGKSADAVEAEITERLQTASKSREESTLQKNEAEKNLATANADIESSHRAYSLAESRLAAAQTAMQAWLAELASRTSRQLTAAELDQILTRDDAWLKAERSALDQLDHDVKSAEGAFNVHSKQLQEHLASRPTPEAEPAVLAALEMQRAEVSAAKDVADAARAVILNDEDRRKNNLAIAEQLECQLAIADPWIKLNDLIGSSQGDKFRMIAQRRTLDILLRHANDQLNQLAVRYRLERLPESLNLIVIDRDMGDERRSVHSLSGGESFLVALALALGLASLASNRLRIESLFIDEGFGSLDPETLNTAMSALMHLEAQGRKVGVISHVTEMTDAIPVQIKVLKGRGGASRIIVPGAVPEIPIEIIRTVFDTQISDGAAGKSVDTIAVGILEILQRDRQIGKDKVSSKALREELGCGSREFKAAQAKLDGQIVVDGRSLRLVET